MPVTLHKNKSWEIFQCDTSYIVYSVTWSYSEEPGYSGHPRNNSAITHPRDHVSIASQNGRPRITSGALLK